MQTPALITKQAEMAVDHIAHDTETPIVVRCDMLEQLAERICEHLDRLCRLRPSCETPAKS